MSSIRSVVIVNGSFISAVYQIGEQPLEKSKREEVFSVVFRYTEGEEVRQASSPITHAAQVKAPVLIIQGHNDTHCPPRSIEVYETNLNRGYGV